MDVNAAGQIFINLIHTCPPVRLLFYFYRYLFISIFSALLDHIILTITNQGGIFLMKADICETKYS